MTLWDRRFGLILGLAFFTFACEDPGEIGLELNPENGDFVARYEEISIQTSIIEHEDILSDNSTRIDEFTQRPTGSGRLLAGNYITQDFGKIQSKGFTSLYLSKSGFNPGESFIFDSLVLSIRVDYLYGQNFTGNKKIYIHELAEEINLDSIYLTKNSTPYLNDPVGEFNLDISIYDTVRVDTVYSARLADELGMRFMEKARTDTLTYSNNVEFRKFFNGFAIVPEQSNEVIVGIHAESQSTFARLYIHDAVDTTFFDFILQGLDTAGFNVTKYYNNITLDKSGTPIEGIPGYNTDFETNNGLTYAQAATGIFTKLNIGSYLNFLDTIDHLVINRAELVIPVENYADFLTPPGSLDLYITGEDNNFVEVYDSLTMGITFATTGRLTFAKDPSENKGQYIGNVTNYIQNLTSGATTDTLLLIGQINLWKSILSVDQFVSPKDQIKLNVYYSALQQ